MSMQTKTIRAKVIAHKPKATGRCEAPYRYEYSVQICGMTLWAGYEPMRPLNFKTEPPSAEDIIREALRRAGAVEA